MESRVPKHLEPIWSPRRDTSDITSSACGLFLRVHGGMARRLGMPVAHRLRMRPPPALLLTRLTPNSTRVSCLNVTRSY